MLVTCTTAKQAKAYVNPSLPHFYITIRWTMNCVMEAVRNPLKTAGYTLAPTSSPKVRTACVGMIP